MRYYDNITQEVEIVSLEINIAMRDIYENVILEK
jgi:hypothetical protein